jgi:hypothetical protein
VHGRHLIVARAAAEAFEEMAHHGNRGGDYSEGGLDETPDDEGEGVVCLGLVRGRWVGRVMLTAKVAVIEKGDGGHLDDACYAGAGEIPRVSIGLCVGGSTGLLTRRPCSWQSPRQSFLCCTCRTGAGASRVAARGRSRKG